MLVGTLFISSILQLEWRAVLLLAGMIAVIDGQNT